MSKELEDFDLLSVNVYLFSTNKSIYIKIGKLRELLVPIALEMSAVAQ